MAVIGVPRVATDGCAQRAGSVAAYAARATADHAATGDSAEVEENSGLLQVFWDRRLELLLRAGDRMP